MERGAQCTVCQDLDVFNSVIPAKSLFQSAKSGCSGCDLLREGINHFTESSDLVDYVELLVDCSLHVAVLDNKKRYLARIEFYTHPGKLKSFSYSHLNPFHRTLGQWFLT